IIAKLLYLSLFNILKLIRFDSAIDFLGLYDFINTHLKDIPSRLVSKLFYWLIILLFISIAINRTGIDMIKEINDYLRIVPSILALITILIFALFIGSVMGKILEIIFAITGILHLKILPFLFGLIFLLIALPFSLSLIDVNVDTTNNLIKLAFETIIICSGLSFAVASIDYFKNIIYYFKIKKKYKTGDTIIYNNEEVKIRNITLTSVEIYAKNGRIIIENKDFFNKEIIKIYL
ncbi:MAG TPA: hypothetical protein PK189_00845, partial [bacterium]|nr:hypothetical protein [bacterium]